MPRESARQDTLFAKSAGVRGGGHGRPTSIENPEHFGADELYPMDRTKLIETAEQYFAAVDAKDIDRVLAFFVPDATFTIATFDAIYRGRDGEIRGMFERLFARYAGIWHGDFDHVVAPPDRLACRFRVVNTAASGERWHKHNCNFFRARGERFDEVLVFMSGDNSLR